MIATFDFVFTTSGFGFLFLRNERFGLMRIQSCRAICKLTLGRVVCTSRSYVYKKDVALSFPVPTVESTAEQAAPCMRYCNAIR